MSEMPGSRFKLSRSSRVRAAKWVPLALACISVTAQASPITSSGDQALAGATVVGFETTPLGNYTSLLIGNLTISGAGFNVGNLLSQYVPPNDVSLASYTQTPFEISPLLTFSIQGGTSAFGLMIGATSEVETLSAYDVSNNLLESITIPNQIATLPFPYFGFYGIRSGASLIDHFTLTARNREVWAVDDIAFVQAAGTIPEPASLALACVALLALRFAGWHARSGRACEANQEES